MDFRARIPVEMWDEVFTHLPREDLRHVHLVDRLFHRLSTPLLFRTVTFHFDKIATPRSDEQYDSSSDEQSDFSSDEQDDSPAVVPPTPAEIAVVENALMRLEVWSSTSIAPLVRVCEIVAPSRCRRSGLFARPETGLPSPSRAFLHALPNFTNLREFTANQLRFTDVAVANLCLLPNLTKLVTRSCTIDLLPVDSFAFTLDLSHFTSWDNAFEAGAADQWVRALRPDTLQDLSIQQGLISNIIDLEYAFLRVKALTFALKGMDLSTIPGILLLLAKFPAAQTLKALTMPGAILAGMPSDVSVELPSIRNYTGPWGLLRFLPLSHLRYIFITDCTFPDFISELRAIQVLHSVTSLEVDIQDYVENLDGLGELFPSLKSLAVWVDFSTGDVDLLESMDKTRVKLSSCASCSYWNSFRFSRSSNNSATTLPSP
ncbi:hypothetical protein DFH09DRAFT_173797 [Mycena vulgaris]|nr:hypothetical protein DFH09DRAFT_173797 [Mycena vulgaris]